MGIAFAYAFCAPAAGSPLYASWCAARRARDAAFAVMDGAPVAQVQDLDDAAMSLQAAMIAAEGELAASRGDAALAVQKLTVALVCERDRGDPDGMGPGWRMVESALLDLLLVMPAIGAIVATALISAGG